MYIENRFTIFWSAAPSYSKVKWMVMNPEYGRFAIRNYITYTYAYLFTVVTALRHLDESIARNQPASNEYVTPSSGRSMARKCLIEVITSHAAVFIYQ